MIFQFNRILSLKGYKYSPLKIINKWLTNSNNHIHKK